MPYNIPKRDPSPAYEPNAHRDQTARNRFTVDVVEKLQSPGVAENCLHTRQSSLRASEGSEQRRGALGGNDRLKGGWVRSIASRHKALSQNPVNPDTDRSPDAKLFQAPTPEEGIVR